MAPETKFIDNCPQDQEISPDSSCLGKVILYPCPIKRAVVEVKKDAQGNLSCQDTKGCALVHAYD